MPDAYMGTNQTLRLTSVSPNELGDGDGNDEGDDYASFDARFDTHPEHAGPRGYEGHQECTDNKRLDPATAASLSANELFVLGMGDPHGHEAQELAAARADPGDAPLSESTRVTSASFEVKLKRVSDLLRSLLSEIYTALDIDPPQTVCCVCGGELAREKREKRRERREEREEKRRERECVCVCVCVLCLCLFLPVCEHGLATGCVPLILTAGMNVFDAGRGVASCDVFTAR